MQVIENNPSLLASWQLLNREKEVAGKLIVGFKRLIWPTVGLLSISVVFLCFVNVILQSQFVAASMLVAVSSGFICLLLFQAQLLLGCLNE